MSQRFEYQFACVDDAPARTVAAFAEKEWRLISITRGYFDERGVFREYGFLLAFERPEHPRHQAKPKALAQNGTKCHTETDATKS